MPNLMCRCIYIKSLQMKEIQEHNKERLKAVQSFLKWYRINSGLNQHELSDYSDVHRNTISRYEACSPKNLTLLTVFEIADALELDVNQIFLEIK
jgi:transcriptional regulator with XRE-family HTH domain